LKTKEEIRQEIQMIKADKAINVNRAEHFEEKGEQENVYMYNRMISDCDAKIDVLRWVLSKD